MCNRAWIRHFVQLVALFAFALTAVAWDGIAPPPVSVNPSGLALGPVLTGLAGRAMWVDAVGRILVLDVFASVNGGQVPTTLPPRCWQLGPRRQIWARWCSPPFCRWMAAHGGSPPDRAAMM